MKKWILGFCAALIGGAMIVGEVDAARRLGGGTSSGAQRSMTNTPPAQKAAPQQQQQQKAAQPQQPGSRWAGILGGLALGGLLGYFLGGQGTGILLMMVLLAVAAVVVFRVMAAKRREGPEPMQYASGPSPREVTLPAAAQPMAGSAGTALPAGFDAAGFLKGAKLNFIKLQAANDAGRVDDIREFTTDEMYGVLKRDIDGRGGAAQRTDVVSLDAELLEVATEGSQHWASVRFAGTIREDAGAAEGFEEVWNLVKPADGSSGWLLAGIQQMH